MTDYNAALRSGFQAGRRDLPRSCNPHPSGYFDWMYNEITDLRQHIDNALS